MTKLNSLSAFAEKHKAPEHHRVKPQEFHRSFHELTGHSYCTRCGAINFKKRWYVDSMQEQAMRKDHRANAILCPGCTRAEQQQYEGEVVLLNSRCKTAMGEIVALIKHIEGRCWHNSRLARIASVTEEKEILHIKTTTRVLAERIGKQLHKTFKGNLEIRRTPEERFVRVYWTD
jgi:NMD protein affecting ribosome stability and mRNA decay